MDPIVSAATESTLTLGARPVNRHWSYFCNYNDKVQEVSRYVEMLDDARKRVQNEVMVAEWDSEDIEEDVQHWLKRVDEKIKEYESFLSDGLREKTKCSFGYFPNNLRLRYWLGRKATKIVEEINADGLLKRNFDKISYRVSPSLDAALANSGYGSFGSRNKTLKMIMKALEDSTVNMIGVHGAGGVGKTTLVKEVAKEAQEKKLFNMVVMVNITSNPNIKKIQGQIAEMLGMRLEEESQIVRADCIRKRLKKENENTLIILDDLWKGLDLNKVGIPFGDDYEKEKLSINFNMIKNEKLYGHHIRIKILLTSRSIEVLCNEMDVEERSTFLVGELDEKEAKTLLKKEAGIIESSEFDTRVTEIARMCAGLPIALASIGRALKNKSSTVWDDVCQKIQSQSFTEGQELVEFSVKLSYEHLEDGQLKHIFLRCARMENDALIMDLVKFCIGLGLLEGIRTIREARDRVRSLIQELKESSLLMESYSTDRFNMHDMVLAVALSIASKEKHVLFMKNDVVDEWPHKDELEGYTDIYLHYCDIKSGLPASTSCPTLKVLHIDSKDEFFTIPDGFFESMIELRVLILTGVNLSCLPSSIRCLSELRMLSLERCTIGKDLSIIGELKNLLILTLSGSNIENLPIELGQ